MFRGARIFGFTTLCWFLTSVTALAQVSASPAAPAKASSLEDSVQTLAGEIKDLNATVQELRAEVSRSRQETRELRVELQGAIDKLSASTLAANPQAKPASTMLAAPAAPATPPAATESATNAARLSRLEEDQQLLQAKVEEQHQTKVESASKYRVKLSGIVLVNAFGNHGSVDNQDVPNLALAPGPLATSGNVGATARQSEIGLEAYGPSIAGAQVSANVNFDFMGGFSNVTNGVTDNMMRLRTATPIRR